MIRPDDSPPRGLYLCPKCRRSIVNRAAAKCLYCGEPLPEELRFTPAQIAEFEADDARRRAAQEEFFKKIADVGKWPDDCGTANDITLF